jgi:DNA replication and repair protein RecF
MITSLELKHIRCFEHKVFNFSNPITMVIGNNGTGKTSILEALYINSCGRSFRTGQLQEIIMHDQDAAGIIVKTDDTIVTSNFYKPSTEIENPKSIRPCQRSFRINTMPIKTYQELAQSYHAVSLTQEDLFLVIGQPELKRHFIDVTISTLHHEYYTLLASYKRILLQRNALLKQSYYDENSYVLWTEQLLTTSQAIRSLRISTLLAIQEQLVNLDIPWAPITLTYQPQSNTLTTLYEQKNYKKLYTIEQIRGHSKIGAHYDDIMVAINGMDAKAYASRGQQRRASILIKLASTLLTTRLSLLLVDDILADFDEATATQLFSIITQHHEQIIGSCPQESAAIKMISYLENTSIKSINSGKKGYTTIVL